jgi:hypothetical protein
MLGAVRRVISGENMDEEGPHQHQQLQTSVNNDPPNSNNNMNDVSTTFAIVENDDDNDNNAMDIDNNNNNNINEDDNTVGSSISDVSLAKQNDRYNNNMNDLVEVDPHHRFMVVMDDTTISKLPLDPLPRSTAEVVPSITKPCSIRNLNRSDSRNSSDSYASSLGRQSSQNSSRDWGWFEETEHGHMTSYAFRRGPLTVKEELQLLNQQQRQQKRASLTQGKTSVEDDAPTLKKGSRSNTRKGLGTSLLPHMDLMSIDGMLLDETQQILLDPPTDLESGKSDFTVTSCLDGTKTIIRCFVQFVA